MNRSKCKIVQEDERNSLVKYYRNQLSNVVKNCFFLWIGEFFRENITNDRCPNASGSLKCS